MIDESVGDTVSGKERCTCVIAANCPDMELISV